VLFTKHLKLILFHICSLSSPDRANSWRRILKNRCDVKIAWYLSQPIPEFYWARPCFSAIHKAAPEKFLLTVIRILGAPWKLTFPAVQNACCTATKDLISLLVPVL